MSFAPVALFCYNRVETLQQVVAALQANEYAAESDLFIFSDGAKNEADQEKVDRVREYIRTLQGFKSITVREAGANKGLANSIIAGVTEVVNSYGKIIVLEDDIVTAPYFLKWMNQALELYQDEELVAGIQGWTPSLNFGDRPDTYFIREVGCWGWATWKRGWDLFEADSGKLLKGFSSAEERRLFNVYDTYPYYEMLVNQHEGWSDSWAIRWYASVFQKGRLGLQPGKTLVANIGYQSGTHCFFEEAYEGDMISPVPPRLEKREIKFDEDLLKNVHVRYNKSVYQRSLTECLLPFKFKCVLKKLKHKLLG